MPYNFDKIIILSFIVGVSFAARIYELFIKWNEIYTPIFEHYLDIDVAFPVNVNVIYQIAVFELRSSRISWSEWLDRNFPLRSLWPGRFWSVLLLKAIIALLGSTISSQWLPFLLNMLK